MNQAQLLAPKATKYTAEYFIAFVCISEGSYKTKNLFKRQKIFQKYFFALWGKHLQFDSDLISQLQASVTGGPSTRQFSLLIF